MLLCRALFVTLSAAPFAQLAPPRAAHANRPWMNKSLTPHEGAELLVREMTLDEKISQIHMRALKRFPREVIGIERLGLPAFKIANGPAGAGGRQQAAAAGNGPAGRTGFGGRLGSRISPNFRPNRR